MLKDMFKKIQWSKVLPVAFAFVLMVAPVYAAYAQLPVPSEIGNIQGLRKDEVSVNALIARVISWMLIISFAVAVLFLIIGGFQYMTSAGNEEAAEKGKGTVVNALIGIVIIIMSYVLVSVVSNAIGKSGSGGF